MFELKVHKGFTYAGLQSRTYRNMYLWRRTVNTLSRHGAPVADSIKISNILSGQCLAKTKAGNSLPLEKNNCSSKCNLGRVADAPEDITALFYDE
uniref:Uncharacterized protein n=1 Tax=Daucus carota subsp. sativus TaxID=79200 RepID=A0A165XAS3_DAUCS